jgi:hypothetical protein
MPLAAIYVRSSSDRSRPPNSMDVSETTAACEQEISGLVRLALAAAVSNPIAGELG